MSTQELKEELHKKIDSVEDENVLKQALQVLNGELGTKKHIDLFKNADRIMEENKNLFKRLAQ